MVLYTHVDTASLRFLLEHGFHLAEAKRYEQLRYQGPCTVILFDSGKLLVQGREDAVKHTQQIFAHHKIGTLVPPVRFKSYTGTVIGSDECMKGDTFGGIIVAGVKADDVQRSALIRLGIADSKTLSDTEIPYLATEIRKGFPHVVYSLSPHEYNVQVEKRKVTALLNTLHAKAGVALGKGKHVVDQFPGCRAGDHAETHAEQKYVEVAAASILARAACLAQFQQLERKAGFSLPKGSSQVAAALRELKKRNVPFEEFVKLNFKNVRAML